MIIYKITNNITNQSYIGKTINEFNRRYRSGKWWKYTSNIYLKRAVNVHGKENFTVDIICNAFSTEDLNYLEKHFISYYNSLVPNGYNFTEGGEDYKFCEESKDRMSIAKKGIPITDSHKNNISKGLKEYYETNPSYTRTPEIIQKQINNKPYYVPWNLVIIHEQNKGKPRSEETKRKISESNKGKFVSKEHIEKMRLLSIRSVRATNIKTGETLIFSSLQETKKLGFSPSCVSDVCRGRNKTHKGYYWEYFGESSDAK